ncbi:hypothetical protein SETIT_6G123000v2 [Setaria italica]|uniref:Zinc knuckle CX2CX4HX4C domain-containing protein n=1 Tax=Setaria italica TaxID=4555 RepID=A0A368RMG1_SETIT|nr:hypothetical protein SETIT_6G123000v2 [Setaria italica]
MAAARLLIEKHFAEQSLQSTMRAAWNTAREVVFRPIEKNLFVVQAFCLGDWKRIMEDGPWIFRGIPLLYRMEAILQQLASKVGEVLSVEMKVVATGAGDFHRARVKYEKLSRFCSHCGKMGHTHLECGTREHEEEDMQFGVWMVAEEELWHPGACELLTLNSKALRGGTTSDHGGRGLRGGRARRGGARGGARESLWREEAASLDSNDTRKTSVEMVGLNVGRVADLEDTASSPIKPEDSGVECIAAAKVIKHLNTAQRTAASDATTEVPPPPPQEQKRMKKTGAAATASPPKSKSGSPVEHSQAK